MSLFAVVASAALGVAAQPVHTLQLDHRGDTFQIDYRPHVETRMRTLGMAAGPRPSTQLCRVTAHVSVERAIAGTQRGPELKAMLPGTETFTRHLPGDCRGRAAEADRLLASKADEITAHLGRAASNDRQAALAAIDAAHHLAAN